jgi:NAD(P)-dependent dehydrogenase (short-subunit alcohol dehydrogenase family)
MGRLEGQRALVTGAGSGIGRATSLLLAAEGASVAVLDLDAAAAGQVAEEVGGLAVVADMADADAVAEAVDHVEAELGGLGILVNNAGLGSPVRSTSTAIAPTTWSSTPPCAGPSTGSGPPPRSSGPGEVGPS